MSITEDTDLDSQVLKRHYVEIDGAKWEISTVQLVKDPEDDFELIGLLSDLIQDVHWKYETMIFKILKDDARLSEFEFGATSFGYYRSDESEDVVKAHDQIVTLIAEGVLKPVEDTMHNLQISPAIVKAMTQFDTEHPALKE